MKRNIFNKIYPPLISLDGTILRERETQSQRIRRLANLPEKTLGDCWRFVVEAITEIDDKACRNKKCIQSWGLHYHNGSINKFAVGWIEENFEGLMKRLAPYQTKFDL